VPQPRGGLGAAASEPPTHPPPLPGQVSALFQVGAASSVEALRCAARLIVLSLPPVQPPAGTGGGGDGPDAALDPEDGTEARREADAAVEEAAAVGGRACAWGHLRQLLRVVEPYCHPSNAGTHSLDTSQTPPRHFLAVLPPVQRRHTLPRHFPDTS